MEAYHQRRRSHVGKVYELSILFSDVCALPLALRVEWCVFSRDVFRRLRLHHAVLAYDRRVERRLTILVHVDSQRWMFSFYRLQDGVCCGALKL